MFAHKLWLWSPLRCNIPIIHLLLAVVTARYRCPGHSPALGATLLPALNKYFKWGKNNTRRRQKTPVLSQLWAGLRTETSCRNTTDGAPPSPSYPKHILFSREYYFSPNKHNCCKKSLFVSALYHFQHLWDTCTAQWHVCQSQVAMLSRDSPSPKIY